jgi:Fibronectin type III domain
MFLRLWVMLTLLLSTATWAEDKGSSRHSLIHRPNPQVSPSAQLDIPSSQSQSNPQPAPHKLLKKPTMPSPPVAQTDAVPASNSPQSDAAALMSHPIPAGVTAAPATALAADAPVAQIATAPSPRSALGSSIMPTARTGSSAAPIASAVGSTNQTSRLPSSMQRLLQANPSFSKLLNAPTPSVSTPSPSTTPPLASSIGSATLTWAANRESDLAGYRVYVGTSSGTYNFPGSPFTVGKVTTHPVMNLPRNTTYFFAVSAYDVAGNESPLSAEVSKSIF